MTTTRRRDPWAVLEAPTKARTLTARRSAPDSRWPIFWGLDASRRRLLILQHSASTRIPSNLPKFRGVTMEHRRPGGQEPDFLLLQLVQPEYAEVFLEFCADLVRVTSRAETEAEAVSRFIGRTWTWQRFLTVRRSGRLSPQEQMGLIGELRVLGEVLVPIIGEARAVSAWSGPLGTAKDFEVNDDAIEIKTVSDTQSKVRISSEYQLFPDGLNHLFLGVVEVVRADGDEADSTTVTVAAETVRDGLSSADSVILDDFERRLRATGFDWSDDYSDTSWSVGRRRWFTVGPAFPRITPDNLPAGLSAVRYSLDLASCADFSVPEDAVLATLRRS